MRIVVTVGLAVVGLLAGAKGWTQRVDLLHADGPAPAFEVATIKAADMSHPTQFMIYRPGEKNPAHIGEKLRYLILEAYEANGPSPRVFGVPNWADKTLYRIEAKIPDDVFAAMQKMPQEERNHEQALMLQGLLAERFRLKVHFERREMPIYELVAVDKGTVKLPKTQDETGVSIVSVGGPAGTARVRARNVTMQGLADALWIATSRIVVDKTGVPGRFDADMKISPETAVFAAMAAQALQPTVSAPSVFEALKDAGLKLVPGKAMVEVVVIDHIEEPTGN